MDQEERENNRKSFEQNKTKLILGLIEFVYFGFCCFIPKFWTSQVPPSPFEVPFTRITIVYICVVLGPMIPLRSYM